MSRVPFSCPFIVLCETSRVPFYRSPFIVPFHFREPSPNP
jgi:hypothetical protein